MRIFRFLILLCVAVISGNLSAQSQRELSQLMRNRGEYYFTITVNDPAEIQAISKICSVDGTDGRTVVAYANQQEYDKLLQAGYQLNLQTPPSLRANVTMWDGNGTYNWDAYLTYNQYVSMMEEFPSKAISGRFCTLFSLGTLATSNHRQLLGVRINNGSPEGKPKFLYTSTMHGDEITGMILMLRLINELCTSTDSQIVDLVNNLDIYIMPLTNPDGTYKGGNSTVNSAQRYNGNNIDLNRNYKDYYQGVHPDGNDYEDETVWTMAFGDENLFTMSANYHGGAEVMNYPWDATYDNHVDMDWYEYVCTEYVQKARQTYSSYMTDTYSDGVTSGAAWYVITGSRQDYMNAYAQCREVTVECSTTKTPAANQLPYFWNYNRNSMLAFMKQAYNGVHGLVYDAVTNEPIQGVTVTVQNHDNETSFVTTHSVGDFHRPIKGGTYTFNFAKQGYYSQSVQVTVTDGNRQDLTIYLQPNLNLDADFTASTTDVSLGQVISFTDTSEGMVSSWNWTFEGATPSTSTEQNPTGIVYNTPGDYAVTLVVTGPTGNTNQEIKQNYIHVSESILMQNGEVTTCSGLFYDPSGPDSNYGNNLNYTMTFYPETENASISVAFTQFNTEANYDYLYIYNGISTSANLIGQYSGTTSPGTVTATNADGALTFVFTSDGSQTASGWVATVSCVERPEVVMNCYYPTTNVSAGSYTLGYLNGSSIAMPSHNNASTVTTATATVTTTDYGFTAEEGTIPQVTLTAYSNGQYYISYNNRYLARSTYANSLTWGTSTSQYGRWYINSNGIYITRNNTNYYLYYNNGSFALSTTAQNNLTFYQQGDCPVTEFTIAATVNPTDAGTVTGAGTYEEGETCTLTATANEGYTFINWTENGEEVSTEMTYSFNVTADRTLVANFEEEIIDIVQTSTLSAGWNQWTPNVELSGAELLAQLKQALGTNGIKIMAQNGRYLSYNANTNTWMGNLTSIEVGVMYKINVSTACEVTLTGPAVDPANHPITLYHGNNWIGFIGSETMSLSQALSNYTPTQGDKIMYNNRYATFNGSSWIGNLTQLVPGNGYIYKSNASGVQTLNFNCDK